MDMMTKFWANNINLNFGNKVTDLVSVLPLPMLLLRMSSTLTNNKSISPDQKQTGIASQPVAISKVHIIFYHYSVMMI